VATARDNRCGAAALVNWQALMTQLHPWVSGGPLQESQIGGPTEWFWTLVSLGTATKMLRSVC